MQKTSARIYPDVNIFLTLDFQQQALLRKCTIFKESIQKANIDCYLLSTVKKVRDNIATEVVDAGGNALRGLWNHLCMYKGAGLPYVLANETIQQTDLPSIQSYFRQKIIAQKRDLAKSQIQTIEVWAIDVFRELENQFNGKIPVMEYLGRLSLYLNDYYVEAKNAFLRTESELRIINEEQVNPKRSEIDTLEQTLNAVGFDDREDICHLAALLWLKQNKGYKPIFATADRKLYEQKEFVLEKTGIIIEDPLYTVGTYNTINK